MKVTFRTNLGTRDAAELGLDHAKCQAGEEVEVDAKTGESLVARGLCVGEVAKKKPILAVPAKPTIAKGKESKVKE